MWQWKVGHINIVLRLMLSPSVRFDKLGSINSVQKIRSENYGPKRSVRKIQFDRFGSLQRVIMLRLRLKTVIMKKIWRPNCSNCFWQWRDLIRSKGKNALMINTFDRHVKHPKVNLWIQEKGQSSEMKKIIKYSNNLWPGKKTNQ